VIIGKTYTMGVGRIWIMHKKSLFGVLFIIAVLLWGVVQWAFGNLLWAWFVQYIEANWHVGEAQLITSFARWGIPAFLIFILIAGMYWIIKQLHASTNPVPDMKINEALDYIVNDSKAKLKQPPPEKIEDFGPSIGRRSVKHLGVEHEDARAKVNEKLIVGELSAWGYRQLQYLWYSLSHICDPFQQNIGMDYRYTFSLVYITQINVPKRLKYQGSRNPIILPA
jgi:hypothetical protein